MAQAVWHTSASNSNMAEVDLSAQKGDVHIRSAYSLISLGTERIVATGQVPASVQAAMRVPYMQGSFDFPLTYGYSLVGEVVSEGPLSGRYVHVMHPHQDHCIVDVQDVFPIPEEIPVKRTTLASNLETAVNALWDSKIRVGEQVLIVGFGLIGSLVARLAQRVPGVRVFVDEKNAKRRAMARQMQFAMASEASEAFDLAFHSSGSASGLQLCIDRLGVEGRVVELSWFGNKPVEVDLGGTFHQNRKQIIGSQVSRIPSSMSHRWSTSRRKALVFELLKESFWDAHLTHEVAFEESAAWFEAFRKQDFYNGLSCCIKYEK